MGHGIVIAALLALSAPAAAAPRDLDAEQSAARETASAALLGGRPQAALDAIDPVIAVYQAAYATDTRRQYCGMTTTQTLAYMAQAAGEKKAAVALGPGYCDALFIKGYALVDLNRLLEARTVYEQLVALAPMHSHFLSELGQSYRPERNWAKMLETCQRAAGVTDLAKPDRIKAEKGLAWRCMGYALVEQGKLDQAEALYRQCLEVDGNDAKAKGELQYIADQRKKRT